MDAKSDPQLKTADKNGNRNFKPLRESPNASAATPGRSNGSCYAHTTPSVRLKTRMIVDEGAASGPESQTGKVPRELFAHERRLPSHDLGVYEEHVRIVRKAWP
jgi:hypothetical protein